jgi:hypothetical protein
MEAKAMKRKTMTNISGGAHRAEVFCVEEEPAMPPLWQDEFNRACDAFLMQRETGYAKRFKENSDRANRAWKRKKEKV